MDYDPEVWDRWLYRQPGLFAMAAFGEELKGINHWAFQQGVSQADWAAPNMDDWFGAASEAGNQVEGDERLMRFERDR